MEHRTYGDTKDCQGCRYWSEMIAKADENTNGVEAMCLNKNSISHYQKYTWATLTCGSWESGHLGAIDEPGSNPLRYENERTSCADTKE